MKRLAIMQPYFFPYIGYWQLIKSVDIFVVYDNIEYTKKGWINRNRYLLNGKDVYFTIPLKKQSDFLNIDQRIISEMFDREKLKNKITAAYKKAPYYTPVFELFKSIIEYNEDNLFKFLQNSIIQMTRYLNITTKVIVSSGLAIDHSLKAQEKVISICNELNSDMYINPIGGEELYTTEEFSLNGIELKFIKTNPIIYKQFDNKFIPSLSIIDVMMFNSVEQIKLMLGEYTLV